MGRVLGGVVKVVPRGASSQEVADSGVLKMKFHHIGIACKDMNESIRQIQEIYQVLSVSDIVFDQDQKANLCFLKTGNGIDIELIAGDQVKGILEKGIEYYHVCYEVSNIRENIDSLSKKGAFVVSEPKPAKLFDKRKVAFLYTGTGLIELLEE